MEMHQVVLLIGGNVGNRLHYLTKATERLEASFTLVKKSGVYETEAWGGNASGNYLNQALVMNTRYQPFQVLNITQEIELNLDRKRDIRWGNRTMDIDIIYYDDDIIVTPLLHVPHPLLHKRRFVLVPLVEIIPDFIHPILKVSQSVLLDMVSDSSAVTKLQELSNR
jgi:2-amino-4-hydroxy-6-hydroxymethyldihydropteridine diphosphokinase